jgi:NAD(P)-dependent dehydrogenase (short-subunit alcohol dehydrogenase family)
MRQQMNLLDGKVAVICGGTSGIGAKTAALFASEGASVVIGGRREILGHELASALGARVRFTRVDVAVESDVAALVADTVRDFGRLDILINNAGIGGQASAGWGALDLERFWAVLAVHVGGVVAAIKHASPVMIAQGSGSIVNTASVGGHLGGWTGVDYSTAKAAVIHLTRCAAIELGRYGIRVNSVSPGPIPTGIFGKAAGMDPAASDRTAIQLAPAFEAVLSSYQSIQRAGTPADVANALLWLASDASSFVTGQDIAVDGGVTAGRPIAVSRDERTKLAAAFALLR